jgi:thiol-disulfide isomerase/thioredoxin
LSHVANEASESPTPSDQSSGGSFWALLVLLVAAAATLIALQGGRPKPGGGAYVGKIFPPLDAAGWINTKGPLTAEDVRGKIVLVDFWASDCIPCIQKLPELIEFNKRYRDRGVMIVGLSQEMGLRAQHLKSLIETREGLDWPNGYGAVLAYEIMSIYGTPTYLLYDRSGRSVWGGHSLDGLEDAMTALLAKEVVSR